MLASKNLNMLTCKRFDGEINMQYDFFNDEKIENAIKILVVIEDKFELWKAKQPQVIKNKIDNQQVTGKAGESFLVDDAQGNLYLTGVILKDVHDYLVFGRLAVSLPEGNYEIEAADFSQEELNYFALGWGMGAYSYIKKPVKAKLLLNGYYDSKWIDLRLRAIFLTRNLINMPASELFPKRFAGLVADLMKQYGINVNIYEEGQLANEFPMVEAVGRGSNHAPVLVELEYGKVGDPKVVLVGKGVCFDAGGLDLKGANYMLDMKKDMAGAAHALALAQMIIEAQLPIHLKLLLPLVENMPSGTAYKPKDILRSRSGKTVEVLNTDAEGRLILADALTYASEWKPALIIDFATLTGAATVALGNDLSALFGNRPEIVEQIKQQLNNVQERVWELPLYHPYLSALQSSVADLSNIAEENIGGGAITAALFLEQFVSAAWVHLDIFANNNRTKPGRPKGGEAVALQGIFNYLVNFGQSFKNV